MLPKTPFKPNARPRLRATRISHAVPTGWYMEQNRPMAQSPAAISPGDRASPVATEERPAPKKKTAIIPRALHRSPSHPAGNAPAPNKMNPGSASESRLP